MDDRGAFYVEREKDRIVRLINALHPGAKIYLFGSRARGTHRETSDIDLAVDAGRPLEINELGQLRSMLEIVRIPLKIDVVDFQRAEGDFRDMILRDRMLWTS